jgi:hypothetical protein
MRGGNNFSISYQPVRHEGGPRQQLLNGTPADGSGRWTPAARFPAPI